MNFKNQKVNSLCFRYIFLLVTSNWVFSSTSIASTFDAAVAQFSPAFGSCFPVFNGFSAADETYANTAQGFGTASAKAYASGGSLGAFADSSSVGTSLSLTTRSVPVAGLLLRSLMSSSASPMKTRMAASSRLHFL